MTTLQYQNGGNAKKEERKRLRMRLFGPSRDDVWTSLADEIGARFVDRGFWHGGKRVVGTSGPWQITLDLVPAGKTHCTRMRAPYVNADGFRFVVYRAGIFTGLAEKLGFPDVKVGHPEFDRDFVIKGNDEAKLKKLFANPTLRQLISAQQEVSFEVRDDEGWFGAAFPKGVDELRFLALGTILDVDRLKLLYDLFAETLHTLCHIGSAYEDDPHINL